MSHLTGKQIAAAMSLADVTQDDLFKKTGISRSTISKIVRGVGRPQEDTLSILQKTLEAKNIEFIGSVGVKLAEQSLKTLIGDEGLRQFFNGVHEYASQNGGTIMMFGIDETTFIEKIGNDFSQDYLKRMTEVSRKRSNLEVLAIICEGDTNFCASAYNKYRWISKDMFQAVPFYIYGETLAIMDFDTTPAPTIILIKSRAITNAYRKQFQGFWQMARVPTTEKKKRKP